MTDVPNPDEIHRWQDEAACRGVDTDLFFPERGASTVEAKEICASCPVIADCKAEHVNEKFGVWFGTSDRERRRLRRDRAKAARALADRS